MSHHDVLFATNQMGAHVVLCEHSASERGYLSGFLRQWLQKELGDEVEVKVSRSDREPLQVA
jgi:putative NIF3 family GTP cyclohydrolase 1 type 2